ncbi:winged helix-turn-helix transcriptional regulator [Streptomyces sp. NPDC102360]|uniref:winged helix-turn-helix transcriptional regulator n=1 Tax=Streptomyces sp. NPDC102360 TaxID=3366160 RepID=UPI0037FEDF8C
MLRREWLPDVLQALTPGPLQYRALLTAVRDTCQTVGSQATEERPGRRYLQDSVLNRTLASMRELGLLVRNREPTFPYRTTYEATVAGRELLDALEPLAAWAERHERTRVDDGNNDAGEG